MYYLKYISKQFKLLFFFHFHNAFFYNLAKNRKSEFSTVTGKRNTPRLIPGNRKLNRRNNGGRYFYSL